MTRRPVQGERHFECESCAAAWSEKTRDCLSPSGEHCANCGDFCAPHAATPRPEWDTDNAGNLAKHGDATL